MSVTVKNSAIQDLTLTHTIIIQIIFLLMKWLLGSFWLLFTDQFKTSTSPQAKKYKSKGKLKEVRMKLQNIRFVYIKKELISFYTRTEKVS